MSVPRTCSPQRINESSQTLPACAWTCILSKWTQTEPDLLPAGDSPIGRSTGPDGVSRKLFGRPKRTTFAPACHRCTEASVTTLICPPPTNASSARSMHSGRVREQPFQVISSACVTVRKSSWPRITTGTSSSSTCTPPTGKQLSTLSCGALPVRDQARLRHGPPKLDAYTLLPSSGGVLGEGRPKNYRRLVPRGALDPLRHWNGNALGYPQPPVPTHCSSSNPGQTIPQLKGFGVIQIVPRIGPVHRAFLRAGYAGHLNFVDYK